LYDPQEGQVLIDGRDVREYDPDELRGEFGVLFQDYVSYQFSARENIGIGRVERLDDTSAIAAAADKSGASSVIEGLPQGYDTVLGKWFDGGVNLSGGEWQKVALGRAFMREAQILILGGPGRQGGIRAVLTPARAGPRAHGDLHLTSVFNGAPGRPHPGLRTGPPDRVGHTRRAIGARRPLRGVVQSPGRVLSLKPSGGGRRWRNGRT
jgi:ATP-binding cassette subfamily B protein